MAANGSMLSFVRRHALLSSLLALAAALPSAYVLYLYYKRYHRTGDENSLSRRQDKLIELRVKLERLLVSLDQIDPEAADTEDDECIVCNSAKAVIQTFPCQHKVLCRICFVKTLQVAVNEFNLPLKCVLCRTRITTLDRERHEENTNSTGN